MHNVVLLAAPDSALAQALAVRNLPDIHLQVYAPAAVPEEVLAEAEVIVGAPDHIVPLVRGAQRLRWVQSTWAGVTPLLQNGEPPYQLTALKAVFGDVMSEYVLGWLLALERRVLVHSRSKRWLTGRESSVRGKRMGIMGTGSIGTVVAQRANAFGIECVGLNRDGRSGSGFERCYATSDRLSFATGLDYLVGLMPHTPDTDALVDAVLLAQLAPTAIFINAGRANAVSHGDLVSALEDGRLRAAVLDVLPDEPLSSSDPLWSVENLHITSHTAAPTADAMIVDVFADNYQRYVSGQPLAHLVDFARGY